MLEEFDFVLLQLRYIKSTMDQIPSYRPDGRTVAEVQALVASTNDVRTEYLDTRAALALARGTRHTAYDAVHDASIAFSAQAKSAYRKVTAVASMLDNLPTQDTSLVEIITRGRASAAAWGKLPPLGTPPAAFAVKQGEETLTQAELIALIGAAVAAEDDLPVKDQDFQMAEGTLHAKQAEIQDVVTAALQQGRSQFPNSATPQREVIDAIPTQPSTLPPGPAVIDSLTSPAAGQAALTYSAPHGTSFTVLHEAPGGGGAVEVASDRIEKTFTMSGLGAGLHSFQVIAHNSQGDGDPSAPTPITL